MRTLQNNNVEHYLRKLKNIQSDIEYHEREITVLKEEKKEVVGQLVTAMILQMKELDESVPQWRQHCAGVLTELKEVLEHKLEKGVQP